MYVHKPITYANVETLRIRSRRGIPHFELDNGIYFLTFRLADSLPPEIRERLAAERERILRATATGAQPSPMQYARVATIFGERLDTALDAGSGECHLRNHDIANLVHGAIQHFDGKRYRLMAWSVMPNHAHAVLQLFLGRDLGRVMHSWKSFTGTEANRILRRRGRFWQREYFDRIVRDERELGNVIRYTIENPAQAGLAKWPFVGCRDWWR